MNKKGEQLTEESSGIIIAVIGMLLLSVAAYYIYDSITTDSEIDSARNTIDVVGDKINALDVGESGEITIQGFKNSQNWYLVGWDYIDDSRPDQCFFDSCLCICNDQVCSDKLFCSKLDSKQVDVMAYTVSGQTYNYVKLKEGLLIINVFRYNQAYTEIDSLRIDYCNSDDGKCVMPDLNNLLVQNG